jgi:hypothetical protein
MSPERTAEEPNADDGSRGGDTDTTDETTEPDGGRVEPRGAPDIGDLDDRLAELRAEFDSFEDEIEDRTVDKPTLKADLERYVRRTLRRGHARGWGPYLILLYGTVMTLGAFYWLSNDWLAILAMLIIFLSTLGLYTLFVLVGVGFNLLGAPGKALDFVRDRRE